jgi:cysteine desulfurase / selenocysteine lyase
MFTGATSGTRTFDAASIRNDFPILQEKVHGRRLIWLDNGATTQKLQAVIDRLAAFYAHENSNVHRGAHTLAARATDAYEAARDKVRRFIGASSPSEIIFVRGTTEGINLVAQAWGRRNVKAGDEIVITWLEHHANIVPWQQLYLETGARLRVAPVDDNGDIILDEYEKLLGPRTRIVALSQVSNALGTVTPARCGASSRRAGPGRRRAVGRAQTHGRAGARRRLLCVFGTQNVRAHRHRRPLRETTHSGCNAPLAGRRQHDRRRDIREDDLPERSVALRGGNRKHRRRSGSRRGDRLSRWYRHGAHFASRTPTRRKPGISRKPAIACSISSWVRTEDVGRALDREGIAVRAGHHCAQPILRRFGLESTVRPSFALYNTSEDVEALVAAVRRIALEAMGGSR